MEMSKVIYDEVLKQLKDHPAQIEDLEEWLFVTINTMKAIVMSSAKGQEQIVLDAIKCGSTQEIQQIYDRIQGLYGREGFSYRNHPNYYYLSSLVARYSEQELTEADKNRIRDYYNTDVYLLYEIG
ncbi:MAG: hypothetical protein IKH46_14970 [Lachnospiraceae bacterium]|nr:hypothetical protein [Lachnospiraceae bacterium]